jgi:hypothetical protein
MAMINAAITRGFDLFFAPFARANPWLGMVAISLLSGLVLLLIFRYTSNQRGIRAAKDRIIAHLLAVWLYRDELSVVLRSQAGVFVDDLRYLGYALVPLACMILPVGIFLLQTDLRYGHRPLRVGEQAIVAAQIRPEAGPVDDVTISAPPGIRVETPALRMPALGEVDWRVRAVAPGRHELRFAVQGVEFTKEIVVGDHMTRVAPRRVDDGVWPQLLNPGEPPLAAAGPAAWVEVSYPDAWLRLRGWRMHWIWPWLVLSLIFGYALKGPLRVQV